MQSYRDFETILFDVLLSGKRCLRRDTQLRAANTYNVRHPQQRLPLLRLTSVREFCMCVTTTSIYIEEKIDAPATERDESVK